MRAYTSHSGFSNPFLESAMQRYMKINYFSLQREWQKEAEILSFFESIQSLSHASLLKEQNPFLQYLKGKNSQFSRECWLCTDNSISILTELAARSKILRSGIVRTYSSVYKNFIMQRNYGVSKIWTMLKFSINRTVPKELYLLKNGNRFLSSNMKPWLQRTGKASGRTGRLDPKNGFFVVRGMNIVLAIGSSSSSFAFATNNCHFQHFPPLSQSTTHPSRHPTNH